MIEDSLWLLAELMALFLGISFAIQLLQRWFGPDKVRRWMGGRPLVAALKGIAIGFVTPFCTYSAIPMLVGLRQAGVPPAGYVAFLSAAPVLDPVLLGALILIIGAPAAVAYALVAFVAALALALVAQRFGIDDRFPLPALADDGSAGDGTGCDAAVERPWAGLRTETAAAARYAGGLTRSVGLLLVVGVLIGLGIEASVQPDDVAVITGGNAAWSIPVAAALGTPLYFSTSLFVPIANSLGNAGVGIGAIVALTISGAGANVPEFIILARLAAKRLIAVFFSYVFLVALVGGGMAHLLAG